MMDQPQYDAIPFTGAVPMPASTDASVMEMRWESSSFIFRLWQLLAGRVPMEVDGQIKLVREKDGVAPIMNDEGATRVIQLITTGFVNPVVSLSNVTDDDARLMFEFAFDDFMDALVLKSDEYGIKDVGDLMLLRSSLRPLLFSQMMRPVGGHEARSSKAQVGEQVVKQESTNKMQGGFSLNPLKRN